MDSSKFFNRKLNIRDPQKSYQKGKVVEESANYKSRVFSRVKENPTTKSLISIRRKVISIENTLKSIFNLNKKSDQSKQKFILLAAQEKKSKKKISAPNLNLGNIIERPKTGAMDFISNFLTFTFLGWLFTRLQPLIGKLEGLLPIIEGAFDFLGGTVKFLIDGLGSFIKFGYDAYDGIKGAKKGIEDQTANIQKTFDDTTKALGDLIDGTVKVATSFLDVFKEPYDKISQTQDGKDAVNLNFASLTSISTLTATSFASGGGIDQGRINPSTPITRGVQQERKSIKPKPVVQAQKTTPGKDVGGESKIKEIYGENGGMFKFDFVPLPSFFRKDKKSGYTALVSTSEEYKKQRSEDILGIGNLMGASVDTALGQKPDRKTYSQFADGIKYLVDYGMTNPEEFSKINLEEMIRRIVEPKVEQAIMKIREEVNKKSSTGAPGDDNVPNIPGGGAAVESIDMTGFSPEDVDALGRMIAAESAGESAIGKAGVLAVILNRYRLIKSGQASPSSFNVHGKTKEQVTLRDILFAGGKGPGNQFSPYKNGSFERTSSSSGKAALAEAIRAGGNDPEKFKKELIKSGLSETDADYVVRSVSFSNPGSRSSRPFNTKEITVGNHVFQQSPNVKLTGSISRVDAQVKEMESQIQALSSGFRTGLRTGPAGRIGAGTEYHVDARFIETLPLKDKIAMLDSMAAAHAQEGFVMEFSGRGVAGSRWNPNAPLSEKEKLAKKILASHHTRRPPFQAFDYFIVKRSSRGRGDKSAEGSNIMAPIISGGTYEYQQGGGYGRHLIIRDKSGNVVAKIGHGDEGLPSPKQIGKIFKMDELKEAKEETANKPSSRPETAISQQPSPTPPKASEAYMINGKMYYVDTKGQGKVTDQNGAVIDFSGDKNKWLLKEIQTRRQIQKKKYGGLVYSNASRPVLPEEKYASYNDPMMSTQLVIQPIIVQNVVPVQDSKQTIIFAPPRVNSSGKSKKLMRN